MSKVWFITGCSKGFGRVLTEQLMEFGDDQVVATARQPETLQDLVDKYGARLLALKLDVTKQEDIQRSVDQALKTFGRIDVLVNNAGYGLGGALEECTMEDIRAIFETNVFGLMEVTKAVLPTMRQQKSGTILNLSSVAGLTSQAGAGIYNATKFAVEGLSESLALDVAPFGIRVTLIEPGPFRTDFAGGSCQMSVAHPAYQGTPAESIRKYLADAHNNQPGDPVRAAQIMIQVVDMKDPPMRLPLGKIALERIALKSEAQAKEFAQYAALARSADYGMTAESIPQLG